MDQQHVANISDWHQLATDTKDALLEAARATSVAAIGMHQWDAKAVATAIAIRSAGLLSGAILVTEYGLVSEGRTLARGIVENAFGMGALKVDPSEFIRMLRKDSAISTRAQAMFAKDKLNTTKAQRKALQKAIEFTEKHERERMRFDKLADMSTLRRFYLNYQRLSDGAAHLSVTSLRRHVTKGPAGTKFTWGVGSDADNESTFSIAVMAALAVGIGLSEVFDNDRAINQAFAALALRCEALPQAAPI